MATYDLTSSIPSASNIKSGDILNCPYSGNKITLTLPAGTYKLQTWGAEGGENPNNEGVPGKGGYSEGTLTLTEETTVYLYVGGKGSYGTSTCGGFNGGGISSGSKTNVTNGAGGGGGTDIRIGTDSLYARIIVSGGGGASGNGTSGDSIAGNGGGETGENGTGTSSCGTGGTQTAAGEFGGSSTDNDPAEFGKGGGGPNGTVGCGGGGGWYGGGFGTRTNGAAGGGSGYVYTASTAANYPSGCLLTSALYLANAKTVSGATTFEAPTGGTETGHTGNGYIRITTISTDSGGGDDSGEHIINEKGSATFNYPDKIEAGDKLIFNITNTNEATGYMGTLIPYEIPVNCKIKITAKGSRGGYGNFYNHAVSDTTKSGRGASCTATFEFKKGDKLLLLVGQHGKDAATATGGTRDGVTGGGGGMSVVALQDDTASYTFVGHTKNNSTQYAGNKYKPLIVAAGGNGARDNGYSGTGTVYHGQAHTTSAEALGSTSNSNCPGGTFSKQVNTNHGDNSSYRHGLSFLYGGLGSQYDYTRGGMSSLGGFGCGGANYDDGNGGGAGGWISGYRGVAAKSYIDNTIATERSSIAGDNADDGIIIFEVLEVENAPLLYSKNNANQLVSSRNNYVYVNSTLKYKKIKELYVKTASNGWVKAT